MARVKGAPAGGATDAAFVDICICTFRRTHVAQTLRSIAQCAPIPGMAVRVIVADNDDTPSARTLVETTARDSALNVLYLHAPARNISVARNACLAAATAPLVMFIDDDERVTGDWLLAMVTTQRDTGADAVLGPVRAVYGPECPRWMREGDFHSSTTDWKDGEPASGYSGNVLFRPGAPAFRGLRFREDLGRSGGEDAFFFAQAIQAGARFAYAPAAIVTEEVPAERARAAWLVKRSFRSGQTHGLWLLHSGGGAALPRSRNTLLAALKALVCLTAAGCTILSRRRTMFWFLRGAMHVGVAARLLGQGELELYGSTVRI